MVHYFKVVSELRNYKYNKKFKEIRVRAYGDDKNEFSLIFHKAQCKSIGDIQINDYIKVDKLNIITCTTKVDGLQTILKCKRVTILDLSEYGTMHTTQRGLVMYVNGTLTIPSVLEYKYNRENNTSGIVLRVQDRELEVNIYISTSCVEYIEFLKRNKRNSCRVKVFGHINNRQFKSNHQSREQIYLKVYEMTVAE